MSTSTDLVSDDARIDLSGLAEQTQMPEANDDNFPMPEGTVIDLSSFEIEDSVTLAMAERLLSSSKPNMVSNGNRIILVVMPLSVLGFFSVHCAAANLDSSDTLLAALVCLLFLAAILTYFKKALTTIAPSRIDENAFVIESRHIEDIGIALQSRKGVGEHVWKSMHFATFVPSSHISSQGDKGDTCTSCPICLGDYQNGEVTCSTPCRHDFHQSCLREWLTIATTCPLCNQNMDEPGNSVQA